MRLKERISFGVMGLELKNEFQDVSVMMESELLMYKGFGCPISTCRGNCSECQVQMTLKARPR